ncbi:hypothetical protein C0431_05405 [bacterium]|jgi:hypothetical protein|nr:hypothetical protein [bacterium]
MKQTPHSQKTAFSTVLTAIRATWPPMLVIQLANALLVYSYFNIPTATRALDQVSQWREQGGIIAVLLAGFVAGGVLPEIAKILTGKVKKLDNSWAVAATYVGIVYSIIGFLVYLLYFVQVSLFSASNDPATVLKKVLFDMLVFSPFLSIPFATGMLIWRKRAFQISAWKEVIIPSSYRENVLPGVILCWIFWFPVMSSIYVLPLKLQFPIAMLCEAAWTIVFVFNVQELTAEPVLVE